MKRLFLIVFLTIFLLPAASAQASAQYEPRPKPGYGLCIAFSHANQEVDAHATTECYASPKAYVDRLSYLRSIGYPRLGVGYQYVDEQGYNLSLVGVDCNRGDRVSGDPYMPTGWNDRLSSVKVTSPNCSGMAMYRDAKYKGDSIYCQATCDVLVTNPPNETNLDNQVSAFAFLKV